MQCHRLVRKYSIVVIKMFLLLTKHLLFIKETLKSLVYTIMVLFFLYFHQFKPFYPLFSPFYYTTSLLGINLWHALLILAAVNFPALPAATSSQFGKNITLLSMLVCQLFVHKVILMFSVLYRLTHLYTLLETSF